MTVRELIEDLSKIDDENLRVYVNSQDTLFDLKVLNISEVVVLRSLSDYDDKPKVILVTEN